MTLLDALQKGVLFLKDFQIPSARLEAELLLSFALGIHRNQLLLSNHRVLSPGEEQRYEELLQRRSQREPVAYILQKQEFMSLEFWVNPAVLIPRPETEHLVEAILSRVSPGYRVWDIGTGSGCIAISLAKYSQPSYILASDLSHQALEVARKNGDAHQVGEKIEFVQGNLFDPGREKEKFDIIVMNPPYIGREEACHLAEELKYEPESALFAEKSGLFFYEKFGQEASKYLREKGWIALELSGTQQSSRVIEMLKPTFSSFEVLQDYSGMDRVLIAYLEEERTSHGHV